EVEPLLLRHALEPRRAHLARGADREALAGDHEGLAPVHPAAEVRHEVAEGSRLPALVEGVEALGDAVIPRRDLVGVDRVALLAGARGVPANQRAAANRGRRAARRG